MSDFLIGRQQILDRNLDTYAYEILFRGQNYDLNQNDGATKATNQVITDSILEIGLNDIVGTSKAFINFTSQNILEKTPISLPKDRIVIEVLENVTVDLRIINNLRELHQLGYTIALDDFVYSEDWKPLLEIADIIKLDVLQMGLPETEKCIAKLQQYQGDLLAEKVETLEEFQALQNMGCIFFQGFFFSKPNIVAGKRLGINQTSAIRLLSIINQTDVDFTEITQIISQDVGLSYKLLHYINSAFFSLPNKIDTINHAITCLGLTEIKRWTNILTLASLSDKPQAVLLNSLIRAKMCEHLAEQVNENTEQFFLIGMFSCLDCFLDMPIDDALVQLPIAKDISDAILYKKSIAGEALQCVINYERWNLSCIAFQELDQELIGEAYLQSITWAKNVLGNVD